MALREGKRAPAFSSETETGSALQLKDLKGAWVILYFYPKDDTSSCTAEACDFRDNMKVLAKKGVRVIGVSPDSAKKHQKFIEKYDLNFTLLADTEKVVCEKYDVWKEKSMYGRKYMGVIRTTYIIDPSGEIVKTFDKVKVTGHVAEVRNTLVELGAYS
ncbi:MAG: thioredoxin-dependent thiol peroxidase [Ignavibacteria bacterium]|nr:thioredoxin-dependent thiol peroxidase [Ignavibacteria bacterium]